MSVDARDIGFLGSRITRGSEWGTHMHVKAIYQCLLLSWALFALLLCEGGSLIEPGTQRVHQFGEAI